MRILILSDTHGEDQYFPEILRMAGPIDLLVHAGDFEGSDMLYDEYAGVPFWGVSGNNDFLSDLPFEREFYIGPYKTLLTHGHSYDVDESTERLYRAARTRNAQICIFGHTHVPLIMRRKNILILNPGSIAYPRQKGRQSSFMILEMDAAFSLHPKLFYLTEHRST